MMILFLLFLFLLVVDWLLPLVVTICEGAYNVTGETAAEKRDRETYGLDDFSIEDRDSRED
jgi:hypothetical protein